MRIRAFFKHVWLQFKMDFRERNMLMTFYLVPLIFYAVMGAVFSSINPQAKETLAASMSLFAVTMGAVLGVPAPILKMRESGTLRAYRVNGVPGAAILLSQGISAFLHLCIVSAIITVTAPMIFGASRPDNYLIYAAIMVLMIIASIIIGLLIGVVAKNNAISIMLSQLVFLPSLLLGGLMFPAAMLPEPLMYIGRMLPATHAMQALSGTVFNITPDIQPYISILFIAAIGILVGMIVAIRFNRINKIA